MRPPPGYPFAGDLPSRPPGPLAGAPKSEVVGSPLGAAFILAFAGAMMGAGFMLVAVVSAEARHAALSAEAPQMSIAPEDEALRGPTTPSRVVDSPTQVAPATPRNIPVHPVRFLEGCSSGDLETIERVLAAAIGKGAPLYNDGDFVGCADAYENGARELEGSLSASCAGPARALAEGRAAASKLTEPSGRAWAFRDAFDGLIEILDRSRTSGVSSL